MQQSIWFQTLDLDQQRVLNESQPLPDSADVVIVGAGMIGLATAYYLARAGRKNICILDRGTALGEASGANAGGLWFGQQSAELGSLSPLARREQPPVRCVGARVLVRHGAAGNAGAAGGRRRGVREQKARRGWCGRRDFAPKASAANRARALEPGLGVTPAAAIYYADEGHLHPAKLAAALLKHLKSQGVRVCLGVAVEELQPQVVTNRGSIQSDLVVVATGAWTPLVTKLLGWQPPIRPIRGTLLALGPLPKTLHHTLTTSTFYYWQLASGFVAGGGSLDDVGFEAGVNPDTTRQIRRAMNERIPAVAALPTKCAWSGFRPHCADLRPVIGQVPGHERVYVAAGHFRKGIMMSPVTGKILADLMTEGKTDLPIDEANPARFS